MVRDFSHQQYQVNSTLGFNISSVPTTKKDLPVTSCRQEVASGDPMDFDLEDPVAEICGIREGDFYLMINSSEF